MLEGLVADNWTMTPRTVPEWKNLSLGDMEKRTGLLRCYTSRIENRAPKYRNAEALGALWKFRCTDCFYEGGQDAREPELITPRDRGRTVVYHRQGAPELLAFAGNEHRG
jgi:hypothetical protein